MSDRPIIGQISQYVARRHVNGDHYQLVITIDDNETIIDYLWPDNLVVHFDNLMEEDEEELVEECVDLGEEDVEEEEEVEVEQQNIDGHEASFSHPPVLPEEAGGFLEALAAFQHPDYEYSDGYGIHGYYEALIDYHGFDFQEDMTIWFHRTSHNRSLAGHVGVGFLQDLPNYEDTLHEE